jgi:GT2 family glycosyltransferase
VVTGNGARRRPGDGGGTAVTVVVLTRNRADEVTRTVGRMLALPARPAVIVVDNGSSDDTVARLAAEHPGVDVIRAGRNLGAAGRNLGVRRAATPFVALCDDDTWWLPGSLDRAGAALEADPRIAVVSGRVVLDGEDDATCALMAASPVPARPGLPGPAILGFLAGASMVRRDAFLAAGGFEPRLLIGAEEELLALDLARLGWEAVYLDDVVVMHRPSARRDGDGRRILHVRNRLWVSWLRHPPDLAVRRTVDVLRRAAHDSDAARGLVRAAAGLPWVLRNRRPVPTRVAAAARLVEAAGAGPRRAAYTGSTSR